MQNRWLQGYSHPRLLHLERAPLSSFATRITTRRFRRNKSLTTSGKNNETKTVSQKSREGTSNANQTSLSQESAISQTTPGDASTHTATMETVQTREKVVAFQTFPLILKNGNKRILVNCLLDEGSDTTRGRKELITVNVAEDQKVNFVSMTFQVEWQSIDGKVNRRFVKE